MTRTPDEIKKGLEEELPVHYHIDGEPRLTPRQYMELQWLHKDALALVQQLETDKQQLEGLLNHMNQLRDAAAGRALKMEERVHHLEAERDELIWAEGDLCRICKYDEKDPAESPCYTCKRINRGDDYGYEWRGVQKEDS